MNEEQRAEETGASAPLPLPLLHALALLFLAAYALHIAVVPIRSDNDCWWHVKTGQYIVENGLPTHDVFSHTAQDHEWHNHEWLAQIGYYLAWRAGEMSGFGGWRAAILFNGILIALTVGVVYFLAHRISGRVWVAILVAVLCIAIGRRMFHVRPPVMSNLLLAGQLFLLVGVTEGWLRRAWLWVLPPVIALWTNLHGGWLAAGVILAFFAADHGLQAIRHRLPALPLARLPRPVPVRVLGILLPLTLLATFVNPYGWRLYELPARVMTDTELVRSIGELASPDFYFVIDFQLAVLGTLGLAFLLRGFRVRLWELAIYLFFLHQAIQHVRHLALFAIMMAPLTARVLGEATQRAEAALSRWEGRPALPGGLSWRAAPTVCLAVLAVYLAGWVSVNPREGGRWLNPTTPASYAGRNLQYLGGTGYIRERFPSGVADLAEMAELPRRMFNENRYAGYLIWRLAPERNLVFSDSRFDIFGGEFFRLENYVVTAAEVPFRDEEGRVLYRSWRDVLDAHEVGWIVTRGEQRLSRALRRPGQEQWVLGAAWPEMLHDPLEAGWQVWIRDTPENAEAIRRAHNAAPLAGALAGDEVPVH